MAKRLKRCAYIPPALRQGSGVIITGMQQHTCNLPHVLLQRMHTAAVPDLDSKLAPRLYRVHHNEAMVNMVGVWMPHKVCLPALPHMK
jgi:hypothetical protein